MLSARVRREDGGFGPEFDHMLLKVELDEPWLVDVGFGDSFVDPIVFHAGGADQVNGHRYVVLPVGDEWELLREDAKGQVPLYAFRDRAAPVERVSRTCANIIRHRRSRTSPRAGSAASATPDGRVTLANMRFIVTEGKSRRESTLTSEAELRRCLRGAIWNRVG